MSHPAASNECRRIFRTTKYGLPYKLICQHEKGHQGQCRDYDNDAWFEPDPLPA